MGGVPITRYKLMGFEPMLSNESKCVGDYCTLHPYFHTFLEAKYLLNETIEITPILSNLFGSE